MPQRITERVEIAALYGMALTLPLVEGLATGFAALILLAMLVRALTTPREASLQRSTWGMPTWLVALGVLGWGLSGVLAAWLQEHSMQSAQLNRALMALAILGGWRLVQLSNQTLKKTTLCLAAGLALTCLAGLCQVLTGSFPGEALLIDNPSEFRGQLYKPGTLTRALSGVYRNRIKTAKALLVGVAAAVALWQSPPSREKRLLVVSLFAWLFFLHLTYVRTALPAVLAALALLGALLVQPRTRSLLGAGFFCVSFAGLTVAAAAGGTALAWSGPPGAGAVEIRRWIWSRALTLFLDHPIFGTGLGTYGKLSPPYFLSDKALAHTLDAHSLHLTPLVEGGLVGFSFWTMIHVGIALALQRAWAVKNPPGTQPALRNAATTFLAAVVVMGVTHDFLFHPLWALSFWFAVGIILRLSQSQTQRDAKSA